MRSTMTYVGEKRIETVALNTLIVGSGAAGLNSADRLFELGQKDIAVVTEGINCGTSRNTGSDKQTYYKLSLSGDALDSVREMAKDLFLGECVDGDIALCEAAMSAQCFLHLVELGVPFPKNKYGEFIGYQTDHDYSYRASSVGPYTSKIMTECLEKSVTKKNIRIFDKVQIVKLLVDKDRIIGALGLNLDYVEDAEKRYILFQCKNIIYATGGPAALYHHSAYPVEHSGASGLGFEIGAKGKNLTEWQYGLSSLNPRWNVSGTYMQSMPRFVSTDLDGNNKKEFLPKYFKNDVDMQNKIFLKGYQWPFDIKKINDGSSIIDIAVYIETQLNNRRVFLDFKRNPGEQFDFSSISKLSRDYIENANARYNSPIERLIHMNYPAYLFYLEKGIDLKNEMLEIDICAQHNNGGIATDCWWQTEIEGFFAVGEASGSHGVYRPGGSALNSTQVGSLRAAQYISTHREGSADMLSDNTKKELDTFIKTSETIDKQGDINKHILEMKLQMNRVGSAFRNEADISKAVSDIQYSLEHFSSKFKIRDFSELGDYYQFREIIISQYVYLSAMLDYIDNEGKSRGSALYTNKEGELDNAILPETFRYCRDDGKLKNMVQEVLYKNHACYYKWRDVRTIPDVDKSFESVWRSFRDNNNIY